MIAHANWMPPNLTVIQPPFGYTCSVILVPPYVLLQTPLPITDLEDGVDLDDLKIVLYELGIVVDDENDEEE